MSDRRQVRLGEIQQTLLIPLAARARETRRKRPVLRDPKAVEMTEAIDHDFTRQGSAVGGAITVLRTATFDAWVRAFLDRHPDGTVVELGTGLNTRFERVDNGSAHWVDLDLPDTIELRREFFADSERRTMVAASVLDDGWHRLVADRPGPYFFVTEGVLVYLPEEEVTRTLAALAQRFPNALIALDTYTRRAGRRRSDAIAKRDTAPAPWAWACDDPRSLERLGMRVTESATLSQLPRSVHERLPAHYRYLLALAAPLLNDFFTLTLFEAAGATA
jgi:O-methyltransferase involved in polyketide biosynthesis